MSAALICGEATNPSGQLTVRFKGPCPSKGTTVTFATEVCPESTVTTVVSVAIMSSTALSALTVIVQSPGMRLETVTEVSVEAAVWLIVQTDPQE